MFFKTICCANIFFPGNPNSSQDEDSWTNYCTTKPFPTKFPTEVSQPNYYSHKFSPQGVSTNPFTKQICPSTSSQQKEKTTEVPTQAGLGKGLTLTMRNSDKFVQQVFSIKFWFIYIYIYTYIYIYLNMFDLFLCTPLIHFFVYFLFIYSFIHYWFIECFLILWNVF